MAIMTGAGLREVSNIHLKSNKLTYLSRQMYCICLKEALVTPSISFLKKLNFIRNSNAEYHSLAEMLTKTTVIFDVLSFERQGCTLCTDRLTGSTRCKGFDKNANKKNSVMMLKLRSLDPNQCVVRKKPSLQIEFCVTC